MRRSRRGKVSSLAKHLKTAAGVRCSKINGRCNNKESEEKNMNTENIREFREVRNMDEANELLKTGRWRVLDMRYEDDDRIITMVRVKAG